MTSFDQLKVQAEYFNAAIKEWTAVSGTLSTSASAVQSVGRIPTLWGSAGSLNDVVKQVNGIRDIVADKLLATGAINTTAMATQLREIGNAYVAQEAANAEEVAKIKQIIEGN